MISTLLMGSALAAGQLPAIPPVPQAMPGRYMPVQAAQPAPAPMPVPQAAPMPMNGGAAAPPAAPEPAANGNGGGEEKKEEEAPPATKYAIMKLLEGTAFGQLLDDRGVTIQGWAAMNYTGSSARRSNRPITFNDRANFYQFNQNWFEVTKAIDTSKEEVQLGYRVSTILPGYDYQFTLPRGLWNGQFPDQYGIDPVYHYAELFAPGIGPKGTTFRAGRWGTSIGYEVIDAVNTPFVTKSYNFQYNPFTHTGVMATSQISDNVTIYNGAVTGADVYIDPAGTASYVGGIKWAPEKGKTSVAFNVFFTGKGWNAAEAFQHFNSYNLLITHKFGCEDKWTYVLDATYSDANSTDPALARGGRAANWYGFANYLIYQLSDTVTSNFRVELFHDTYGVRTNTDGLYTAVTYGLTWAPQDYLLIRPFGRFDHNQNGPFEGRKTLGTGGVEVIFRY